MGKLLSRPEFQLIEPLSGWEVWGPTRKQSLGVGRSVWAASLSSGQGNFSTPALGPSPPAGGLSRYTRWPGVVPAASFRERRPPAPNSQLFGVLLGCTSQACKACTHPALRQEKEPGVCDRDIHGLMDGGAYTSRARSWSNAPPCAPAGHGGSLRSWREGDIASYRGN